MSSTPSISPRPTSNTRADNPTVVFTLGLLLSLSVFAMDVSLPVFALIAADLGATPAQAQLIVSLFLIGYALGQIPVGLMADRYGRLPVLYTGLVVFFAATLFNALASDFNQLLIGRFFQGLSTACGAVIGRAIVRDIADGKRLSQLMAVMVSFLSVMSFMAPLIGSFLMLHWSWRSTFWATAALSVAILALIYRNLDETHTPLQNGHSAAQQLKVSLSIFISTPQCVWGTFLVAIPFSGYMIVVSSTSTILDNIYSIEPTWIGLMFGLAVLSYLAGTTLTRVLVNRIGIWKLFRLGAGMFLLAAVLLIMISLLDVVPLLLLWGVVAVYLFAVGIFFPSGTSLVLQGVPSVAGFGASILGTAQMTLAAITTWLVSIFYAHSSASVTLMLAVLGIMTVVIYLAGYRFIQKSVQARELQT